MVEAVDEELHAVEEGEVHDHVAAVEAVGLDEDLDDVGVAVYVLAAADGGAVAHDVRALELEEFAYNHVPRGLKGFDEGVFHAGLGEGLGAE